MFCSSISDAISVLSDLRDSYSKKARSRKHVQQSLEIAIRALYAERDRQTFSSWMENECKRDDCYPAMDANTALHFLVKYLLGDDWYSDFCIGAEQTNTHVV